MRHASERLNEIEGFAGTNLALACEKARGEVAAHPSEEEPAALLTRLVHRLAGSAASDHGRQKKVAPVVREAERLLDQGAAEEAEIALRANLSKTPNDTE